MDNRLIHLRLYTLKPMDLKSGVLFLLLVSALHVAQAQTQLGKASVPGSTAARPPDSFSTLTNSGSGNVNDRLARVRAELAVPAAASASAYVRRSLLQRLERLYEQEIVNAADLESIKALRDLVLRESRDWTGFSEPKPYSIFLSDTLRESIRVERLEISKSESAIATLQKLIDQKRRLLNEAEEKIRQLNEDLETNHQADNLVRKREMERLQSQVAAATIGVLDQERRIHLEKLAISRIRLDLLQKQLVFANAAAVLTDADIQKARDLLDSEQKHAENELAETVVREEEAARELDIAREELLEAQRASPPNASRITRAQEVLELRRAQLDAAHTALNALRFMLQANSVARMMWEVRFESFRSGSADTIRQTEHRLHEFRSRITLWKDYYDSLLSAASRHVALQEQRLAILDPNSDLAPLARARLAALRERDQILFRVVRHIERGDRLVLALAETIREASQSLPLSGRIRNVFFDARSLIARLWHLELFSAQDTIVVEGQQITGKRSVTVAKILSAILILVVGYWLAGLLSRWIEPIAISRLKIDVNQADLIRRWVRVALVISLAVFSLVSVKIPLTVFAFAGGALAIALGFGMQTLLKNFVSGIIILFERPFRVGDVLDVGGQRGKVIGVGIRSSVLQLWDSTETLIPNSALLENSVTNWTYSDRKVRFIIQVGVAYGSEARRVVQVLTDITQRHGLVEKDPPPQILFTDFADSAMTFEVRFWVDVIKANAAQVSSDLRQMIAVSFAEQGIVIAFPQRDIHFDPTQPLTVQVIQPKEAAPLLDSTDAPKRSVQPARP